jgi:hypothetical protein
MYHFSFLSYSADRVTVTNDKDGPMSFFSWENALKVKKLKNAFIGFKAFNGFSKIMLKINLESFVYFKILMLRGFSSRTLKL